MTQTIPNCTGTIRRWLDTYGFIEANDIDGDVFIHYKNISGEGFRRFYEGDRVAFTAIHTERGWQAQAARRLRG